MVILNSDQLVELWEFGENKLAWQRAMAIISAYFPNVSTEEAVTWPLGYRDKFLLLANELQFGSNIAVQGLCQHCEVKINLSFPTASVLNNDTDLAKSEYTELKIEGTTLTIRPPTTQDLIDVIGKTNPTLSLKKKLIGEARKTSKEIIKTELIDNKIIVDAIEAHIKEVQPLSEIKINAKCPECDKHTPHLFDILDYMWRKISAEVKRLLWDVHLLAKAYGWSSQDILSLSPARRKRHIAMVTD